MRAESPTSITYSLKDKDESFSFTATTINEHTPWSSTWQTPEALLIHLPLPLHWHVHTLASPCSFTLSLPPSANLPAIDTSGTATLHAEKNWAHSFPSAHIWMQAREAASGRSLCLAGGEILGTEAFLLGYRDPATPASDGGGDDGGGPMELDFRPPFAMKVLGYSPFMRIRVDWPNRKVELAVQSFTRKIVVSASAPRDTFFQLSAPYPDGHRRNMLMESFETSIRVEVYQSWWGVGPWKLVAGHEFEKGSLEFGGGYYGESGEKKTE
ncbi:hypothetical protein K402DRAFT_398717 [Aulographum hederae CBS 113979]|uniref:Uncharacterized protein n=1 Tax=Aulographum hederae CBS 113979 TaxID=1176131 RepID=A0A6G1GJT3_9PEZI|nr:hypothetical protein K402DRAFT_398717 [Aulographum hederae CBS 113979]